MDNETRALSRKQMVNRKLGIAHDIRNIKSDYGSVSADEMPEEITAELKALYVELHQLREILGND